MCGIVGYVGPREARPLLLAGLEKLEYRGYDSAGISVLVGDSIDAVRAVGNLSALRSAIASDEDAAAPVAVAEAPAAGHRDRPHALGDPRPGDRGERAPALRHLRPDPHRRQRDRRELRRAQGPAGGAGCRVHVGDRRRGDRPPRRRAQRWRPRRRRARRLRRVARPLRVRGDERRRAGRAGRGAQRVPADHRPRRRRAVHRLGDPGVPARDAPGPVHRERRDRRCAARRRRVPDRRRRAAVARDRRDRLGRGDGREAGLRDVHAQGDPRAGRRGRGDDRRARGARRRDRPRRPRRGRRRAVAQRQADRDGRLRHLLPRRSDRPLRDRGVVAGAGRGRDRVGVSLPQPGRRPRRPRDRDLAVGRDRGHAGGDAHRARARRVGAGADEHHGLAGDARRRRRAVHARGPGDRRRRDEDVRQPGRRLLSDRAAARGAARHARARRADRADH